MDFGDSYLPSELNAAYLWPQLLKADEITDDRLKSWKRYYDGLEELAEKGLIKLPFIPDGCTHNAHMFFIKCKNIEERTALIRYLKDNGIMAVFHYIPLHSAPAGQKYGRFHGEDRFTTKESERLLRLPMYYGLSEKDIDWVIRCIKAFYGGREL